MDDQRVSPQTANYRRRLGQGLKVFYDHPRPDVDIIAVPGLGANPEECWTWTKTPAKGEHSRRKRHPAGASTAASGASDSSTNESFNWIRDDDGLASLYPRSRIMLYDYASAWTGSLKVRATMRSICTCLLEDLKEKRKGGVEATRPLVFIGHSMGGVVVAKVDERIHRPSTVFADRQQALGMARGREEWEGIVTCTTGCAFFGSPFEGSEMAKIALLYNAAFGTDAYESLLSLMRTEKNDALDEIKHDFMEITKMYNPPIDLLCIWEMVPTDISNFSPQMLSKLSKNRYFKVAARKAGEGLLGTKNHFVERESAVLQGAREAGLPSDHRDLIKFESVLTPKFAVVKAALDKMILPAKVSVRKRVHASGQTLLNQRFVNQIRHSLEGVDMRQQFRARTEEGTGSSWLVSEPLYQKWLDSAGPDGSDDAHVLLTGASGLGKTQAALVAIQHRYYAGESQQRIDWTAARTQDFLAYFLCDESAGSNTAEDLLKNLVLQMISQEESLAHHAKWFVRDSRAQISPSDAFHGSDLDTGSTAATATVDNLWKCVQDMVDDPAVTSVHFILSNLHCLEASESTAALLRKLSENAASTKGRAAGSQKSKWLLTSRKETHIRRYLIAGHFAVIDLENNEEYGSKLRRARQDHASKAIAQLQRDKQYSADLAYYVKNSIERQSQDESWIDILCLLLGALPAQSNRLTVSGWLRKTAVLNTRQLIDHTWLDILARNDTYRAEIEEVVQSVIIAYEPPTLSELCVLTGIDEPDRLADLVSKSAPILRLERSGPRAGRVTFSHPEFAAHLLDKLHGQSEQGISHRQQYHGLIAIRCFEWMKAFYSTHSGGRFRSDEPMALQRSLTVSARLSRNADVLDVRNDDEDPDQHDQHDENLPSTSPHECLYPIKYMMHHLGGSFPDAVDELFRDEPDFWRGVSVLRDAWLRDLAVLTSEMKTFNVNGMSALHIAAGIEAAELVSVLVSKCGKEALSWTSDDGITALHVAAMNKRPSVTDKLIRDGADPNRGDGDTGTALHFAARQGKTAIMEILLKNGANVNALDHSGSPVINAAIQSGTVEAVRLIMKEDVRFDIDYTRCESPLSLSARQAETLFREILESEREKWLQNSKLLDQALISAAESGRLESVQILLQFQHIYTNNTLQASMLGAARSQKWATVSVLLEYAIAQTAEGHRRDIRLEKLFYLSAASKESRLDILQRIWEFSSDTVSPEILGFSLYQACALRKTETTMLLLETCSASANASSDRPQSLQEDEAVALSADDYGTVLNAAASSGNASLVRLLVERGAKLDDERDYSLQIAAREGHLDAVVTLLDLGADAEREVADNIEIGFYSGTALQAACESDRRAVVKALMDADANPNHGGGVFAYPIVAAAQLSEPDVLKMLLERSTTEVNVSGGHDQSTPLINAASHMPTPVVDELLLRGADIDATNASGDTSLIMAARRGDKSCIEMLCRRGADVTYRSPRHGSAIQVATQKSHPACADIMTEMMQEAIVDYREKVKIDPSKARLEETLTQLHERDETIEGLQSQLSDAKDSLDDANRIRDFYKLENERLESIDSVKGAQFGSLSEQLRGMQIERSELQKQIDSEKGQKDMANRTMMEQKRIIIDLQQQIGDLRKRQGFLKLQEERKAALETAETERKNAERLQQELSEMKAAVDQLQRTVSSHEESSTAARETMRELMYRIDVERLQNQDKDSEIQRLSEETSALQAQCREAQGTLASIQEAATRKTTSPVLDRPLTAEPDSANGAGDYFAPAANGPATGNGSSHDSSTSQANSPPALPPRRSGLPSPPALSPSEGGFRTIHGHHRPDGSLGGYRAGKGMRRAPSGGLNGVGSPGEVNGGRSMSTDSLGSNRRSANGSLGATKEEDDLYGT